MAIVLSGLSILLGLVSLGCFIMVIIAMFQNNNAVLGIACIVLAFCVIGLLIAFIYGWVKSSEWGISNIMMAWTAVIVLGIIIRLVGAFALGVTGAV